MSAVRDRDRWAALHAVIALARSAHAFPAVAVTVLATALGVRSDLSSATLALLAVAVFCGQLVVGWTNDLIDRHRDRLVGRTDKPLATGELDARLVTALVGVAGVVCVVTSLACGLAAGVVHLTLGVGVALAYNLGVKATLWSWVPYLVAFGSMPVVVTLAASPAHLPPVWMVAVAGLLGVGAHLLNALPDLDDDATTGVRGLPHRLGGRRVPVVAGLLLVVATVVCVIATTPAWWHWVALVAVVIAVAVTVRAPGRGPFHAAILVAGVDVAMLLFA